MKRKEYHEALDKLKIATWSDAANVIGLGLRQVQRFGSGDSPIPEPVARLLRLMIKYKIEPSKVAEMN